LQGRIHVGRGAGRPCWPPEGALAVPIFWVLASIPVPELRWPLVILAGLAAMLSPPAAALFLLTSAFYYSTMAVPSAFLYGLRVLWLVSFLTWWLVVLRESVSQRAWFWLLAGSVLLGVGALVASLRFGTLGTGLRTPQWEAAVSWMWMFAIVPGWGLLKLRGGELSGRDVSAIAVAWTVSIGYGVVQYVFGVTDQTVPADVWQQIERFDQYVKLGRTPFAALTPNGMAVASIFAVLLFFAYARRRTLRIVLTGLLGTVVGALSLTRSYLLLFIIIILFLRPLQRVPRGAAILLIGVAAIVTIVIWRTVDPSVIAQVFRLGNDVGGLRAELWDFTLTHMKGWSWFWGMGFGSEIWKSFFAPLSDQKELASPHSALLEVAGQFGLMGTLAYLGLGLNLAYAYWRLRSRPTMAVFPLTGLLILAREQLAASYVFSPNMLSCFFWFTFGMALATLSEASRKGRSLWHPVSRGQPLGPGP